MNFKLNIKTKELLLFLLFSSLITIIGYWGVWKTFFQQDEWAGLGNYYAIIPFSFPEQLVKLYSPLLRGGFVHFLPLLPIINFFKYSLFGSNFEYYSFLSLITHVLCSLAIYLFILKVSGKKISAFVGAAFFAIGASASQSVSWVSASTATQLALFFSLLSIIYWLNWLERDRKKDMICSAMFLILAIFSKETALFLFIFLPVIFYMYKKKINKKILIIFLTTPVLYLLLRVLIFNGDSSFVNLISSLAIFFKDAFLNYLKIILRGTAQLFVPQEFLISIIKAFLVFVNNIFDKKYFYNAFIENVFTKDLMYLFGALFIIIFTKNSRKLYLIFILTSFIPLAFITTGELNSTFLSSRSFYIPIVGLVGILGDYFESFLEKKKYFFVVMLICYFLIHFVTLRTQIVTLKAAGLERRMILDQIKSDYPFLPKNVVFYIDSDTSYYGLPSEVRLLPFQSGFGKTLLVWYYETERFQPPFLESNFLWEIDSQGSKEYNGKTFGYYWDKGQLLSAIKSKQIEPEWIIAYKWYGEERKLVKYSEEFKKELEINEKITK